MPTKSQCSNVDVLSTALKQVFLTGMLSLFGLVGCSTAPASTEAQFPEYKDSVTHLYSSTSCDVTLKYGELIWVNDPTVWQQQAQRLRIPDAVLSRQNIDFSRDFLIIVEMGQKESGGYGIKLESAGVQHLMDENRNSILLIPVTFRSPSDGGYASMALTSPCLVMQLRPDEKTHRIVVKDQYQNEVGSLRID